MGISTGKQLPLMANQKRLWIISQQEGNNPAYNILLTYHLCGEINVALFWKSMGLLFERHHTMFSVFRQHDGSPYIEILPHPVAVELIDFSGSPSESRRDKILSFAGEDSRKPFDIENGPLFRLYLLKEDETSYFFHATVHHLIFDGFSRRAFVKELSEIYTGLVNGLDLKPQPLEFHSYDYAELEKEPLSDEKEEEFTGFWKEYLLDCQPELKFTYDFPRKNDPSGFGYREHFVISDEFSEKLWEISKECNTSLFNTMLTVMGLLFREYTGENDICIGVPVSNRRSNPSLENIFGLFVSTVVVRLQQNGDNNLKEQIGITKDSVRKSVLHSALPFEKIVAAINPERISGVNPFFQISLSWLSNLTIPMNLDGIQGKRTTVNKGVSPFDITFYIWEDEGHIEGEIEYSSDLLKKETIIRLRDNFIHLAELVAENPDVSLKAVSLLSDTDRNMLTEFNNTVKAVPASLIHDLFAQQAHLVPDKTAVISGNSSLSYRELDELSNRLANHLISVGVDGGDVVGICMERTTGMAVAVLGILKAGCCYLPMDPLFPDDRLAYMYEDSGSKILITQSSLSGKLHHFPETKVVFTDTDHEIINGCSPAMPEARIGNQSLAYMIYTSGSTGKPKGVKVHHEAVVNFLLSMKHTPGINSNDRLLAVTTLSFDISVLEIFLPLITGAGLIIADTDDIFDGQRLSDLLVSHDITIMQATPATWNILLGSGWKGKGNLKALCGGEAILPGLIRELLPRVESLWDMYGPTETTVWSTCKQLTDAEPPILVGKPIDNTQIYILDKDNNEVPVGVTGEVCIGGLGVTKGYNNRPELTAEKFIEYGPAGIIYKTGDLGRYLSDGNIELFGRIDTQIKLRGFRIEPGEIESLLSRLPSVQEAVVKVQKFGDNDERLVAFLNVDSEFSQTRDEITAYLSQHLPSYMVPSFFHPTEGFPRLPNGKINKKALLINAIEEESVREFDPQLLTSTQRKLITIWEDVLKNGKIAPSVNFFDLGGTSLLAIRILNKLKEGFGITITFKTFLSNSTVLDIGKIIDSQSKPSINSVQLVHLTGRSRLPLTLNQKRLWLFSILQPEVPSYIIPFTYKFTGSLNQKVFSQSFETIFSRQHIMYSVIREAGGEPYCDIVPRPVNISFIDYSDLSEDGASEKVHELFRDDAAKPFDLANGPLFRIYLVQTKADEYFFRLSVHHIIFDGWSWSVFTKNFNEIYNSLLKGDEADLDVVEFQQYDYADWEKNFKGATDDKELMEFWKENLSDSSQVINFPYDYPRKERSSGKGMYEEIILPAELSDKLKRLGRSSNSSMFTTLLSIFGIQMHKYSGEDDINIGLPVTFRPHSKLENIYGMFVNTVVVRLRYDKEMTFTDSIRMTSESALNAISHQDLPFDSVVEIVNPERSLNANPIFQIGFIWQHKLDHPVNLDGLSSERIIVKERPSVFDLTFYLWEDKGVVTGGIEYNLDILKTETIIRLRDNFISLAQVLADNPDLSLKAVSLLSETDRNMLTEFNNTVKAVPASLIHDLFVQQALMVPDRTAVISGNSSLSYRDLDERSNRLANHLISLGVAGEDVVGICMERTTGMAVAVLGILKAGCCYLPMDPLFPDDRLAYMYEDSGSKVLITQSSLSGKLHHFPETKVVFTDTDHEIINGCSPAMPEARIGNQSLAYMIYTSGSTGKPKGVKVHHEAVVNFLLSMKHTPGINSNDRLLAVTTLSFDISVLEIFLPLITGAGLIIADTDDIFDGQRLSGLLGKHDVTVMQATPATWNILLGTGWRGKGNLKALCGGEAILPGLIRELLPRVESLWDMYGPTETTVWSTCKQLTDAEPPVLVGKPIDNTQIYILDKDNNEVPVGVTGEVCIGGLGVTKGYNNRPELTAEKFIEYGPPGIIYKTGDLGRYLSDGNIELFGRIDNQIKLRGFRIEPGEIESLLSRLPSVQEAVVKVQKFGDNDERLVAFLNVDTDFNQTRDEMTSYLSQHLPSYMVPSFFQPLEGFPRLPNGKINKKLLVMDVDESADGMEIDLSSLTPTQNKLIEIWGDILRNRNFSPAANFFDAGGTSLLAIRILNRIKEDIGYSLTFKAFITNPTVIESGNFIDSQVKPGDNAIEMVHLTGTTNLPLTLNQKRMWMIWQMQPDIASYIISFTYKLTGHLNIPVFRQSIEMLFNRHHTVFSVFRESDGEPFSNIDPKPVDISFIDFSDSPEKEKLTAALINADSVRTFDLENGPLFRLNLIKTGTEEHLLRFSIHHIIFDGWSWSVLVKDLNVIYNNLLTGSLVNLSPIEFYEYDYAGWEEKGAVYNADKGLIEFWKQNLKDSPPILNFPYDFPRPEQPSGKGKFEEFSFSPEMSEKLRLISRAEGTSLFTTMLSIFAIQIQKYSSEDDINIGLPLAYRPHSKLENIFGMFVNTVVVRLEYQKEFTFRDIIHRTSEAAYNAIAHQELPFDSVVEIVNPDRTSGANPLFQVGFVWQHNLDTPISLEGLKCERVAGQERSANFDLTMVMWDDGTIIEGEIEYNTDILRRDTIVRMIENLIHLVSTLVEDPEKALIGISMVSESDMKMLTEINNTEVAIPDCLMQEFFERQAIDNPSRTAVISGDSEISYGELDHKSNQLARHLISIGVSAGEIIGVCVNRSVEMMVSVLGVLKAGACYLPVDPDFPNDRIAYMIADSGAGILISHSSLDYKFEHFHLTKVILIDGDSDTISRYSIEKPKTGADNQSLAYIVYTSGSTGKPKGVMVYHKSVSNWIQSMSKVPGVCSDDTVLAVSTPSFDMSVAELFLTLSNGGRLILPDANDVKDVFSVINMLEKYDVTFLQATPSLWSTLIAYGWEGNNNMRGLSGGEPLSPDLARQLLAKLKELLNYYGPTETTICSVGTRINATDEKIVIGKPIDNTQVYIIDKNSNLLPFGAIGELVIGGAGVARGYIHRPELTLEKFIRLNNAGIVYKTGDIGRFLPDGNIELFGRVDNQIKLRGYRIELGEIESKITLIPGVRDAVVLLNKFGDNDTRLVAFLEVEPDFKLTKNSISDLLAQELPVYMIPSFFQFSEEFPLLPNGKVNKKALKFEMTESENAEELNIDTLLPSHKKMKLIWEEVLKVKNISASADFFDLGGNSLLAIRAINKIKEEFGITLSFKTFIAHSTVLQAGNYIDSHNQKSDAAIILVHNKATTNLPVTLNQKRLWLISKLQPDVPLYITPFTYRFTGNFNVEFFRNSLEILFDRHHIIFSVIKEKDGEPYCNIVPRPVEIPVIDYSGIPEDEKILRVNDIIKEDAGKIFDLENGPLYRFYLIKTGSNEYYFRMSLHHIIFDGWSWSVFAKDLNEIYNSLIEGREYQIETVEFQEYDYALWEQSFKGSDDEMVLKEYWKTTLGDSSPVLNFPYDLPRREQSSGKGLYETIQLPQDLVAKLRRISKAEGSSMFTTMLAIFGIQMNKYSGEDDINIGLPVSYRPHTKLENIIGMFVNTVVVRLKYYKENTFKDILRMTNDSALNAISHQELPFESIVEVVNPERNPNVNPLFQIGFIWQHNFDRPLRLNGVKSEKISGKERSSNFDITVYMWERGGHVEGEIEYNTDLLRQDSIVRLRDNFIALAQVLASNPGITLKNASLLSETDRTMLTEFNNTVKAVPPSLIHDMFVEQALKVPDRTAVISGNSSLSYRDLDERSNRLANHLISLGASGGDAIGICMERTVDMAVAVLGILKAGCCYLPMDPLFPDDRLAYMYEDSGSKVFVTQSSLSGKLQHFPETKVVFTDTDHEIINGCSSVMPEARTGNQSLAYMIYTSGSTGKPKGVKVHHQAVVNFLLSMKHTPGIISNDRVLAVTTLSFDISVLEIFLPLTTGAGLIIADTDDIFDGQRLSSLLERHDVTVMQATPATWNILLGTGWKGKNNLKALCGGEAILPGLIRELLPRVESLWDMYGPTETTVWSTCKQLTDAEPPVLVGKPIDNTQIYILDKDQNEVPVGVTGEVCIGGLGVTKGYNNRPELTAEKFIEWRSAGIIYKTGDLGRYLSDGNIELFGRIDNQIKLRGFRIEPGEIESLLSRLPSVQEAVVKVQKFGDNDERLVAFLNVDSDFSQTRDEMTAYLSQHLPSYMIPSFFQPTEGFPRLPNGKINKKLLVMEVDESAEGVEIDLSSLTSTQNKLIEIWGDILRNRNFSPAANFFDAGGTSLLAIRILNRIKEDIGYSLTFKAFITYPTVIESGNFIDSQVKPTEKSLELVHLTERTNLPLTLNQKRLWMISRLQPDKASYIIPFTYKFTGELNREIFRKSIDILFERHHTIYSVISDVEGVPYCDIVPTPANIAFSDLTEFPEETKRQKLNVVFNADSAKVFDLKNGPMFRLYLLKTGSAEYYLRLSIHHIVFDAWSWSVLLKDLNVIYNSLLKGVSPDLEPIEFQQYDYAKWEIENDKSAEDAELREFWRENLQGSSPLINFPYDFPRREQPSGMGQSETIRLTPATSEKIRAISRKEGSSVFSTMLSLFCIEMHKYTGDDDINIGLPVSYRPHSKLENIIGMFVNTVVVRSKYEKGLTFRDFVRYTNDSALNAISHQELSFENVVRIANPGRSSNSNPLFQVSFVWQHFFDTPVSLEGIKSEKAYGEESITPFDITFYFWENGSVVEGLIEYSTDLLKHDTVIRLKNNFLNLVEKVAENADLPIESVSILTKDEEVLIEGFNQTTTAYPKEKTIIQLFSEQVGLFPNKTAVAFKDSFLTYRELDEKSNQLAHTLRVLGITENEPVGIIAERSIHFITGILAILKAGGGYVPVDPDYPMQRINYIVGDSGCRIVLFQDKFIDLDIPGIRKISLNSASSYSDNITALTVGTTPADLAYIMYTSGTTGMPKGSMIWHKGIVRLVKNVNYMDLSAEDRILLTGAIVFDASTFEIWGMLLNGGTLYFVEKDIILNPKALGEELLKNEITILWLTSALFTQIAESRTDIFRKLKYLISGGDVLSAQHINKVRRDNPSLKVINGYGPTENTTFSTTYLIERDFESNIPIGKPVSNSTTYIFDRNMKYQPIGVRGELYVGGDGLSIGYLNRDDLNKKSFIDHPYRHGERLYKTGDYARWLADGNIEFHGRIDNQLKIRGFRVELEEIATVINELEGVIETVIKPIKLQEGDIRLAAFLNVQEDFKLDVKDIAREIKQKLPPYMVPSSFRLMNGFPTTINGKTDRDALKVDISELTVNENREQVSFTPSEKIIYNIWSESLKTTDISPTDNFFDVGGNSLMAISVFSKIGSAFNLDLGLRVFFDSPRIKDLAEVIEIELHKSVLSGKSSDKSFDDEINIVSGEL